MKSVMFCGLLALGMGAAIQDKLTLTAGDTSASSQGYGQLAYTKAPYRLSSGETLVANTYLSSYSGTTTLAMQRSGYLILYKNWIQTWSAGSAHSLSPKVIMQSGGNFVYSYNNGSPQNPAYVTSAISNTDGNNGAYLLVQDDGQIVVYSSGNMPLWSSIYGNLLNPAAPNILGSGTTLAAGKFLASPNGLNILAMRTDGVLALYQSGSAVWSTPGPYFPGAAATMLATGKFVVALDPNYPLWQTQIGIAGAYLQLGDNGVVAVYNSQGQAFWMA